MLTHPLLLASIKGCYQPKTKSFDDLNNKPPREKKKGKKEKKKKKKRKTKRKTKRKRKGKERKREGAFRQQGRRRQRVHGIKEKERKSPASHHGQPRAAVAAAIVGNPVSRQNPFFTLF